MLVPKMENREPCAIPEFGKPAGMKLTAFTTEFGVVPIFGCCAERMPIENAAAATKRRVRFNDAPPEVLRYGTARCGAVSKKKKPATNRGLEFSSSIVTITD